MRPDLVMADFEVAAQKALKHHFPGVRIKGCWFHFRKAIMKKAFSIGIKPLYRLEGINFGKIN
jgi:hypothetical protein